MNQDGELNAADILLLQLQLLQSWLGIEHDTVVAKASTGHRQPQPAPSPRILDWLITPAQALPANSGFAVLCAQ